MYWDNYIFYAIVKNNRKSSQVPSKPCHPMIYFAKLTNNIANSVLSLIPLMPFTNHIPFLSFASSCLCVCALSSMHFYHVLVHVSTTPVKMQKSSMPTQVQVLQFCNLSAVLNPYSPWLLSSTNLFSISEMLSFQNII